jgi:thiazolinyl imide reductase
MTPRRVLICGTNYGFTYARALARAPDRYTIVGLLARGSERSHRAAARLAVPLVRSAEEVPAGVDLACAALGRDAHPVVLALLQRGIPVLCEHPLPVELVRASLQAARASRTRFHINGHWSGLDASKRFIELAGERRRSSQPVHVLVSATDRALYGVVDILARALTSLHPLYMRPVGRDGPVSLLHGALGSCAATIRIECSRRDDGSEVRDGSPDYLNCYRVILEFREGALSLLGPGGPVIWNVNENRVQDADRPVWESIYDERCSGASLVRQRLVQNLKTVDALAAELDGGPTPPQQEPDYLLGVSKAWETVGDLLAKSLTSG